jgi:hypothetical protein
MIVGANYTGATGATGARRKHSCRLGPRRTAAGSLVTAPCRGLVAKARRTLFARGRKRLGEVVRKKHRGVPGGDVIEAVGH